MDINLIEVLVNIIKKSGLSALEVEENGSKIRLENSFAGSNSIVSNNQNIDFSDGNKNKAEEKTESTEKDMILDEDDYIYIKSPMVGIFYSLEKIGKTEFEQGEKIETGTIVCGIEAMKLVCEIKSEEEGIFDEVLISDGDQVEFGQSLIRLKK